MDPQKVASKSTLKFILLAGLALGLCFGIVSCVVPFLSPQQDSPDKPAVEYTLPEDPLQSRECGKCHSKIFNLLKAKGGRHKIVCRRCHVQFHAYNPKKDNYEESLPKCSQCHSKPHGDRLILCTNCHQQPHTPKEILVSSTLSLNCDSCHAAIDKEIKIFITQHSNFYCSICHHTKHGYKPECMECHMPHSEDMSQPDCLKCHNPHQALQVRYPADIKNTTCAICHNMAYTMLIESGTKHAVFRCTKCHPEKHRTIETCQSCHNPHDKTIIDHNKLCGTCHGIAHSLII